MDGLRRLRARLEARPRADLVRLPTPIHPLRRLSEQLGGPEIWIKRDDLTGLAGGGNKSRKLDFVVADALSSGARTLVTVGAVQSNHTRQTAAAAARSGLDCVLLHNNWVPDPPGHYREVGNLLLSDLLGATLYYDPIERGIGDEGELDAVVERLREEGRRPYPIPAGASEHSLGGLGYAECAAEIAEQSGKLGVRFDHIVHCTGSSSTQAGLLAGFAAMGADRPHVIGVSDDDETDEKTGRVLRLSQATLDELGLAGSIEAGDVKVVASDPSPYGVAAPGTIDAIRRLARTEGIVTDPVYEGKALAGLIDLVHAGRLKGGSRALLLHLGGTPAVHAYAERLRERGTIDLPG